MNPKITKIEKNKFVYKVSILKDEQFYNFNISEDLLIESKFLSTKEITLEEFNNFLNKVPLDSLYIESIKYINKNPRSTKEIKEHLYSLTSSTKLVDDCIAVLNEKNLINDYEYFKTIVDYSIHFKLDGRLKIDQKLNELGLSQFEYKYEIEDLINNIKTLSIKYDSKNKDIPFNSRIDKTKKFLYQKGYSMSDIDSYFKLSYIKKTDESGLIRKDYEKLLIKYDNDINKIKLMLYKKGYQKEEIDSIC